MKKAKTLLALLLAMIIAFSGAVCAFAADPEETENNGTLATADVFGLGSSIKGKIGDENDVDYYTFTAKETGLATVTLEHDAKTGADASASYFQVTIMDSTGDYIDSFKSAGSAKSVSIDFSVSPSTYYIEIKWDRVLDDSLEYVLSAKLNSNALFEKEPNDITSQATAMTLSKKGDNKLYYGAITEGDVDYYQVSISSPSLALFGIYNTASKSGSYKASFIKVVDGINGKPAEKVIGTLTIGDGEEVKDSPLFGVNGGTYYLKVEGLTASCTGGYQVRVFTGASNSTDEYEYNNEEKYANLIDVSKSVSGNIFDTKDVDIYRFNAAKGNNGFKIIASDFDAKREVTNGQWLIEITDINGIAIEDKATVLNSETVTVETDALEEGVYYIRVTSGNVFTGETYKVSLEAKSASANGGNGSSDITTFGDLFNQLKTIDWTGFWKNFEGWLASVNVLGILKDLLPSFAQLLSDLVFSKM